MIHEITPCEIMQDVDHSSATLLNLPMLSSENLKICHPSQFIDWGLK